MAPMNFASKTRKISFASGTSYEPFQNSTTRVQLQLQCPGSVLDSCEKVLHAWQCTKCNEPIARDSDNNFYCACGKAGNENFTFKCSSENHGPEFLSFPPETISKFLKEISELNVLVIGVVEEDAATWINSFVNYLTFSTLKEADGTMIAATPFSFSVVDQNDDLQKIKFGGDKTEDGTVRVNLYAVGNTLVRLIDIPGLRRSSDVENVKKNFLKLLLYLRDLKELHGICFLPKNDVYFELCFKEFVTQFSYCSMRNVVFCFTGRKSFKSGIMREFLTKLLSENKLDITLDKSRMYTLDADCFQFVCAKSQGIRFIEEDRNEYSKIWAVSVEESKRLFLYFKSLKPHDLVDTISVMEAKRCITYFSFAISLVLDNIAGKLSEIYLAVQPNTQVPNLVVQPLAGLQVVCINVKCMQRNAHSFAVCHENCVLEDIPLRIAGDQKLRNCLAMGNGENLYCKTCGCFWDYHMQINCVQSYNVEPLIYVAPPSQMMTAQSPFGSSGMFGHPVGYLVSAPPPVPDAKAKVKELEEEQSKLIEISIKIGHYLSKLSLVSYTDRMMQYFGCFIKREEQKSNESNEFKLRLVDMRNRYFAEDKLYRKTNAEELDERDFQRFIDDLCNLKHYGNRFKTLIAGWKEEKKDDVIEVFHDFSKLKV